MRSLLLAILLSFCAVGQDLTIKNYEGQRAPLNAETFNDVILPGMKAFFGEGTEVSTKTPLPVSQMPIPFDSEAYDVFLDLDIVQDDIAFSAVTDNTITLGAELPDLDTIVGAYITQVEGTTSFNGIYALDHGATDEINSPYPANGEYTTGGVVRVMQGFTATKDIAIDRIVMTGEDTGSAALFSTTNAPDVWIGAFNPDYPGEYINFLDFTTPSTLTQYGGELTTFTYNSIAFSSVVLKERSMICPAGWRVFACPRSDLNLSDHQVMFSVRPTTSITPSFAMLSQATNFIALVNNLERPDSRKYAGENMLTNGDFSDFTGNIPDDFSIPLPYEAGTYDNNGQLKVYLTPEQTTEDGETPGRHVVMQAVTLTQGEEYTLQAQVKGSYWALLVIRPTSNAGVFISEPSKTALKNAAYTFTADGTEIGVAMVFLVQNTIYIADNMELIHND